MMKKYKIILIACVIAIFCVSVVKYHFIHEQEKRISLLQKELAETRNQSQKKKKQSEPKIDVRKIKVSKIMETIPDEFLFTEYAANIRALVDQNQLAIENNLIFKPEKIKENTELVKYQTRLSVTGSYARVKKMIADIQNLSGLTYLDDIRLLRGRENQKKVVLHMNISVFFKKGVHENE